MSARSPSAPRRTNAPLLLSLLSLLGWAAGSAWAAPLALFCPGWGLTRSVSVLDRNFGVLGSSLCLSFLVLGAAAVAGQHWGLQPGQVGLGIHALSISLCMLGRLRLASYDRWLAGCPPHPNPMPLWPSRTPACLLLVGAVLLLTARVAPWDSAAPSDSLLLDVARAQSYLLSGDEPLQAGQPLSTQALPAAAVAGLCAATGLPALTALRLVCFGALLACLLLLAEGVSRLLGNRGANRAMLAFVLGFNPLAVVFLLLGDPALPISRRMAPEMDPTITTALASFVQGPGAPLALAFLSLMLFASLSVVRRSSFHVPRLLALGSFGLVAADARVALLVLPGWFLGLLMSWLACRDSPDNDPHSGGRVRRPGEPMVLRAPFWRPALHLALGAGAAALLVSLPELEVTWRREPSWVLLSVVGPGCLLFMPGIRHLNASPGREAFFFVGLATLAGLLAVTLHFPGDNGHLAASVAALLLAIPASHGAIKLAERTRAGGRLLLLLFTGVVALGPVAWLTEQSQATLPLRTRANGRLLDRYQHDDLLAALAAVDALGRNDAVLITDTRDDDLPPALLAAAARRPLLRPQGSLATELERFWSGDAGALTRLRNLPGIRGRELFALSTGPLPAGFQPLHHAGPWVLGRVRAQDVILVTVSSLRADRITPRFMRHTWERAASGVLFQQAISPLPLTGPGLATLLTGLVPMEHQLRRVDAAPLPEDAPQLALSFAARGYRTCAVVALEDDAGLLTGFEQVQQVPGATARELIPLATARMAEADLRPLFLWLHLEDLTPPYELPVALQDEATGDFPFPAHGDPERAAYSVAAWPPLPRPVVGGRELDTRRGVACYDALVRDLDSALHPLLESIPAEDLLLLTAPHGTSLDEHELWFRNGPDLFEPSLRVPLLLLGSGLPPGIDNQLLSLSDVSTLLLEGQRVQRQRVLLESGWRPGLGTGALMDPSSDPGARGLSRRIWGERTATHKTLLTHDGEQLGGVSYDLAADPTEMVPLPADAFELRRIDAWHRRNTPVSVDG